MAQYKILSESVTGKGRNTFLKDAIVDESKLKNIAELESEKAIEKVAEVSTEKQKGGKNATV